MASSSHSLNNNRTETGKKEGAIHHKLSAQIYHKIEPTALLVLPCIIQRGVIT